MPVDPDPLPKSNEDASSRIFAFVDDLFFAAKIQETARKLNVKVEFVKTEAELQERQYNESFVRLMEFEAKRAKELFATAAALLPREDRQSMVAAEIMASVYRALLGQIERDRFRVFEKDYRLSKVDKAARVVTQLLKNF